MMSTGSGSGLHTLSQIVNEVGRIDDLRFQVDRIMWRLSEAMHVERHVFLHERTGPRPLGLFCRDADDSDDTPAQGRSTSALGIDDYASCFDTSDPMDHAFRWRDGGRSAPGTRPTALALRDHMRAGDGVAATVRTAGAGGETTTTMLQLECADFGPQELLLVSLVTVYMHSTFSLHAQALLRDDSDAAVNFTTKERNILHWVVEGKTSWEIGKILSTSERTVKFHLKNVYMKLNVSNRAQAAAMVNRLRLI
ncbi:MAG: helix-turn-helix domain-containing protein [Rhizobacter sp.]